MYGYDDGFGEYSGIRTVAEWYEKYRIVGRLVKDCEATCEVLDKDEDEIS